ncbi:MAG: DNA polymerase IV [Polyangiaceae bacterium]
MAARICCLDLDTFFVSVERLLDPSLVGRPVVVGGRRGQRGVVTAASYEVRAHGVRSGMSMLEASQLAPPDAVFLPTRHNTYGPYAKRVRQVLERYSPVVRTASIDEFYIDFGGCDRLYQAPEDPDGDAGIERMVRRMCRAIADEIGLPASAGIGSSRVIAKIASGRAKPAGVLMIKSGQERAFLLPLPVRKFPGIGPKAEARMRSRGIETLADLVELPQGSLRSQHAQSIAVVEREMAGHGRSSLGRERPAFQEHDPEGLQVGSISNERTFFAALGDDQRILDQLLALTERVCWRARKRGMRARTIALKLRYTDFHTITRSVTGPATDDESILLDRIQILYRQHKTRDLPVRLVGVALSNLVTDDGQLALPFNPRRRVGPAVDQVRLKFGYDALRLGACADTRSRRRA